MMATRSTPELVRAARAWEDDLDYPSAVLSGIVGDARHRASGGYHISIEDNPPGNYSVVRVDDAAPPGKWPRDRAAAIDMSMSPKDMVKCYARVRAVWSNPADPRRRFFNAFNVWDGSGDAVRLDFVTGTASYATPDHKWHNHGEWRRRYVNDPAATRAMLSMLRGESIAAYQKATGDTTMPVPPGQPLLRRGSTGLAVEQLQHALNQAGADLAVDGRFGPATEAALKAFQRRAGVDPDGVYGPATAAKLRSLLEEDDMSWSEQIKRRPWVTQTWPHLGETARADTTVAAIYGFSRLGAERAEKLAAGQEAILAAVAGRDVVAAVEAKLAEHKAEWEERLDAAEAEREEIARLIRQVESGERDAAAVVDEIGRRLSGGD